MVSLSGDVLHSKLATYHDQALQLFDNAVTAKRDNRDNPRRIVPVLETESLAKLSAQDLYKSMKEINKGLPEELREPLEPFSQYCKKDLVELHSRFLKLQAQAREQEALQARFEDDEDDDEEEEEAGNPAD